MAEAPGQMEPPDEPKGEQASPKGERAEFDPEIPMSRAPRSFQQFMAMFMGQLPRRDPLLEKLDTEGVKQLLAQSETSDERDHKRQMHHMYLMAGLGGTGMVAIIGLCWLFLAYQKSEQVEKIIALIV